MSETEGDTPARPRRRRDSAERRPELLRYAAEAFSRTGYAATSLRDIGELAGIKAPSFYHHFSSKDELLEAIVTETLDAIFAMLLQEISGEGGPEEKLRRVIERHMRFIFDNRLQTKVLFEEAHFLKEGHRASVRTKQRAILDIYRRLLRNLSDEGRLRLDNVSLAALNILAIVHGIYRWHDPGRGNDDAVVEATLSMIFGGLLRR